RLPLQAWQAAALDVLYERPSPPGPPPVPLLRPRAVYARGRGPVIQVLPGDLVFAGHLPPTVRTALPAKGPFSNRVVRLPRGEVRFVAFDRTLNDTRTSADSMEIEVEFTGRDGARWRILQSALAPLSPDPVGEPWFGGVVTDTTLHGESGRATPAEPWLVCAMCSWGWADVWRNKKKVASAVPLHVMLSSDVRDDARGFAYACYDCRERPVREVHVIVPPSALLPTPGGFLHVMWEDAEWRGGTPAEVARTAPKLGTEMPTVTLRAVPYLQWSDTAIHLEAGKRYRLVLHNDDPSSAHAMHLHMTPGHGHGHGGEGQRGSRAHGSDMHGTFTAPEDGFPAADGEVKVPLPPAETWVTTVEFEKPGEYHFYCPVWNHHARGMTGKFVVSAPGGGVGGHAHGHQAGGGR
ncbi:MAG: multicopper oxidase domain-containing protein, partial [Gemmatimonadota bacterium]